MILQLTIEGAPRTKKNSQRILINKRTGKPFIMPSGEYEGYERRSAAALRPALMPYKAELPIAEPVNVQARFFMPTHRRVDLTNLLEALDDILVRAGVLADDHAGIIAGHDGSRVLYDKAAPRVEIFISEMDQDGWARDVCVPTAEADALVLAFALARREQRHKDEAAAKKGAKR